MLHDEVFSLFCCCRLLRHDMVAELCESAVKFHQAGGTTSALPKGATSGRANLPGAKDDMYLYVYGNVQVKNLLTSKAGAGVHFEVCIRLITSLCSREIGLYCLNSKLTACMEDAGLLLACTNALCAQSC